MANPDSDVPELKEHELPANRALFGEGPFHAATLDALPDPIFLCTSEGKVVYWNRRAREMAGDADEGIGTMNITEAVPENLRPVVREKLREVLETGSARLEVPVLTGRGRSTPFEITGAPVAQGRKKFICGIARDVSERKEQEEELRQREEQFRLLVEAVKGYAIFMLDPEGCVSTWNAGAERIKGYAEEEILGEHFSVFYPDDDVERGKPKEALETAVREGQWIDEAWRERKDGSRFWAHVTVTALHDEEGSLRGFTKVTRDMTEQKRMQQALRESERKYRRLFEESRDAVVLTTPEGAIVGVNSAAEELFGYSREDLLDLDASELYAEPKERRRRILPALQEATSSRTLEARMRHGDGHTFLASASVTVHRNDEGDPEFIQALVRDITERRRLQRDVLRAQEEERRRLGQDLHDGVASQLTGITLMLSIAAGTLDEDHPAHDRIQQAKELIQESSQNVRRLSRGLSPVHLSEEGLSAALERLAENTGPCRFEEDGDLPALSDEEETHLYWIAQEAVTNARKYAEADEIAVQLNCTEDQLILAVEDDGQGFDRSEVDDGGLGLRTMKYRTELLGGTFTLDSAPGEGTCITCQLRFSGGT